MRIPIRSAARSAVVLGSILLGGCCPAPCAPACPPPCAAPRPMTAPGPIAAPCPPPAPRAPGVPARKGFFTLTYERDSYREPACIEYALITKGGREPHYLAAGQQRGDHQRELAPEDKILFVNVFRLQNGGPPPYGLAGGGASWQFPEQATNKLIASAVVKVTGNVAEGTATYEDGTTSTPSKRDLLPTGAACPEVQPAR